METSFQTTLQKYQQRVDNTLSHYLDALPNTKTNLADAMRHGALLGGKRLRPLLVYAVGEMLGANIQRLDIAAAAIECIHAYSLIHDDLPAMDNAPLRRGKPTCHIQFGEATAILAGDALQTLAYTIVSQAEILPANTRIKIIQELSYASGAAGLCEGQAADLQAEGQNISLSDLEFIHRKKTGVLIRAAVRLGAYTADRQSMMDKLDRYSEAIGLAFQIQDDILDIVGDSANTGKLQGIDHHLQKNTFPSILGLEHAQQKAYDLYLEAMEILKELKGYNTELLMLLTNYIIERNN